MDRRARPADASRPADGGTCVRGALEVFLVALRLGLTSFGGPIAHLAFYREEYVKRRQWLDEATFADLIALSNCLPGPSSSQIQMSIGLRRAGLPGMLGAWLGFTLPSAAVMIAFALGVQMIGAGRLHGLELAALAVVAHAVWGMARSLAPDRERATIAVLAATAVLLLPLVWVQLAVIVVAAVVGVVTMPVAAPPLRGPFPPSRSLPRGVSVGAIVLFAALLVGLPIAREATGSPAIAAIDSFYRVGSLVFGGGHVVLPLMQAEVVPPGWVTDSQFLAGYGAAQALPGPIFTFAAYLGALMAPLGGVLGGIVAVVAVFAPSILLVAGVLPFWDELRRRGDFQSALRGVNAAVVGLLVAALYSPLWTSSVRTAIDFVVALAAFVLLAVWRAPPWLVVVVAGVAGAVIA